MASRHPTLTLFGQRVTIAPPDHECRGYCAVYIERPAADDPAGTGAPTAHLLGHVRPVTRPESVQPIAWHMERVVFPGGGTAPIHAARLERVLARAVIEFQGEHPGTPRA